MLLQIYHWNHGEEKKKKIKINKIDNNSSYYTLLVEIHLEMLLNCCTVFETSNILRVPTIITLHKADHLFDGIY